MIDTKKCKKCPPKCLTCNESTALESKCLTCHSSRKNLTNCEECSDGFYEHYYIYPYCDWCP